MGQEDAILKYLQAGHSLTPLEALRMFGSMRLGARIFELKAAGHKIESEPFKDENGKHYARYYMIQKEQQFEFPNTKIHNEKNRIRYQTCDRIIS